MSLFTIGYNALIF